MGDQARTLKKLSNGERKKQSSKGAKGKGSAVKRSLSAYTLTQAEMEEIHMLSDAAKIHHGFDAVQFVVENNTEKERLKDVGMCLEAEEDSLEARASHTRGSAYYSKGSGKSVHVDVVRFTTDPMPDAKINTDMHKPPSNRDPRPRSGRVQNFKNGLRVVGTSNFSNPLYSSVNGTRKRCHISDGASYTCERCVVDE